ncbi:hypothetical protein R9C00_12930 [Flammeovirgaceae bacterium SG7u.111]|nr:hypothetical protein [Flammeovirgaceae bacterium SG7u.132]WPO38359.1 hypothetical protein R9C00_12930 [Flammeovirgaceae bacterium SG7u.111]
MKSFKKFLAITAAILLPFILTSCEEDNPTPDNTPSDEKFEYFTPNSPQPKGDRLFGINITKDKNGFFSAFERTDELPIEIVEINIPWDSIEVSEEVYVNPLGNVLTAIDYYASKNVKVSISLAVLNTVGRTTPDYLDGLPMNDPKVIAAFNKLSDWVMNTVPSSVDVPGFSIGNEVDLVLEGTEWDEYIEFYEATSTHFKTNHPNIKVGSKATVMEGVLGSKLAKVKELNQYSDVVMLTYYPQEGDFRVLDPGFVTKHFLSISGAFTDKPIWLMEVGYQSGEDYCGSSEELQAEFYHNLFKAWDTNKDKIEVINVNWSHDQSAEQIEEFKAYYGLSSPAFIEYLSTLGISNYDGSSKFAFGQIAEETEARAW